MKVFTFSFSSQYMDGFYQVVEKDEESARVRLGHGWGKTTSIELISEFEIGESFEHIVYEREIDNPAYEGRARPNQ